MARHRKTLKHRLLNALRGWLDRPIGAVLGFIQNRARQTKTYFKETPKSEILQEFLAWITVLAIILIPIACAVFVGMHWNHYWR